MQWWMSRKVKGTVLSRSLFVFLIVCYAAFTFFIYFEYLLEEKYELKEETSNTTFMAIA